MKRSTATGVLVALTVLLIGIGVAFTFGRYPISLADLGRVLWTKLTGAPSSLPPAVENVVLQIRGPRVLAAVLVGSALAAAGAALGAVLGIYFSLGVFGIQTLAFAGGLAAVAVVLLVGSAMRGGDTILMLVLTGVIIGSLLGAGVGLIKYVADPYNQLPAITFWLLGSLAATNAADLLPLSAPILLGTLVLIVLRWQMNAMSLLEEEARALGVPTGALRVVVIAAATLVTSASVAAAGIIGWVGLVVPHLARFLVGPSFPRLLPTAAILGGGYLLVIDTLARTMAEVEIPLGILTAIVGTPFFIGLLRSAHRSWS